MISDGEAASWTYSPSRHVPPPVLQQLQERDDSAVRDDVDEERQYWMQQTRMLLSPNILFFGDALLQQQKPEQIHSMDLLNCFLLPIFHKVLERLDKLQRKEEKNSGYGRDLRSLLLEMAEKKFKRLHEFHYQCSTTNVPLPITDLMRLLRNANAHTQVYFGSDELDTSWSSIIREVFPDGDYAVGDNEVFMYNRPSDGRVNMILLCPVDLLTAVLSEVVQDWKSCCLFYANLRESAVPRPHYTATPSSGELLKRRVARMRCELFVKKLEALEAEWMKTCKDLSTAAEEAFEGVFTVCSKKLENGTRKHGDATAEVEYEYPPLF